MFIQMFCSNVPEKAVKKSRNRSDNSVKKCFNRSDFVICTRSVSFYNIYANKYMYVSISFQLTFKTQTKLKSTIYKISLGGGGDPIHVFISPFFITTILELPKCLPCTPRVRQPRPTLSQPRPRLILGLGLCELGMYKLEILLDPLSRYNDTRNISTRIQQ